MTNRDNQVFTDTFGTFDTSGLTLLAGTTALGREPRDLLGQNNTQHDGYYIGATIEHQFTNNVWGLFPATSVHGEVGLQYKNYGTEEDAVRVVPTAVALIGADVEAGQSAIGILPDPTTKALRSLKGITITQFTVSASPKIKLFDGQRLRPWIIPAGLDFHVISPPSDAGSYLDIGVQFGAGLEYELLPGLADLSVENREIC